MTSAEFRSFLHTAIPLAAAMAVEVADLGDEAVVLRAPLEPNINPHGTVFGGSAAALAILAAWSLVHQRLHGAGHRSSEVIQSNAMEYLRPITGPFAARAVLADPAQWSTFERMLARRGKGRVEVAVELTQANEVVARSSAWIVALADGH